MSKPALLVIGAALAALAVTCAAAPALAMTLSPQEAEQVTGISVSDEGTAYEPNKLLISIPNGTRLDELNDILHTCEETNTLSI